jgi:hypothetical protein
MAAVDADVKRRELKLKAKFDSGSSHCSFKRSVPVAFNVGLIGSTCGALPMGACRTVMPSASSSV